MDKKRKLIIIVLCITVLVFAFMGITFATSDSGAVNNAVNVILSPFQRMFTAMGEGTKDFFTYIRDMKTYKEENIDLKDRVAGLEREVRELSSLKAENERLRSVLDLKLQDTESRMIVSEVKSKEPGNWFYVFTIDKGTNHGIQKDDAVMTNQGLVGKVSDVGSSWAEVTTIIDSESSVGAIISRTQDIAIADGDMTLAEQGKCRLNYIKSDLSLVAGDTVETSGLGGVYPKGILIGTVSEIKNDSSGYTRYAVIETAVDFEKIREVIVIKSEE